jgi:hypothetical protein
LANPDLVSTIMLTAALDFAALTLARPLSDIANALLLDVNDDVPDNGRSSIVRASALPR